MTLPITNSLNQVSSKSHRHSFWSGLGFKERANSKKSSSLSLDAYPNQPSHQSPTILNSPLNVSSRVIAMVGNIRTGIGRMILEELVSQKFIVVALIEKPDSLFSQSVQVLASSPSLFHAFVLETGLFDHQVDLSDELDKPLIKFHPIDHPTADLNLRTKRSSRSLVFRSFRLGYNKNKNSKLSPHLSTITTGSSTLGDSTTEISSYSSVHSNNHNHRHHDSGLRDSSRGRTILELKNIFQAYRVDTVISCFEPQTLDPPNGPRSKARLENETQFHLSPLAERARIERMERIVLEACLASGSVNRFAVTVHSTSLAPSVLSPNPTETIRPHLLSVLSDAFKINQSPPPIHITEFRWGFLMNDLAVDDSLADGVVGENGLGKWLCEPPKSRCIIDFSNKKCLIPVRTSQRESTKKGKQKLEPVCMTLAEDVARFIGLACKLKQPWEWKTGRIVGDYVAGGWQETIETIERISKSRLDREYVCLSSSTNGYTRDSGSSDSSLYHLKSPSHSDSLEPNQNPQTHRLSIEDSSFKFEDQLRSSLSKENLDASSVRMKEFVRVWYTPLPQPPRITIDGNGLRSKSHRNSTPGICPRGPFKPQVGENGTLREPTLKAAKTINDRSTANKPHHKFLSVPSTLSSANTAIGQAISTSSPAISSQTTIHTKIHPPLNQQPTQEFNFIPKFIAPFNTNQQCGSQLTNQKPTGPYHDQASSHAQPCNISVPDGMVYSAPISVNGNQQQQKSSDYHLNLPVGSPPTIAPFTPNHRFNPEVLQSTPNNYTHLRAIHNVHSLSSNSRDDNRIFRRSPLATRVA